MVFDPPVSTHPFINQQLIPKRREDAGSKRVMQHFMEVKAWRGRGSRDKGEPTRGEGRDYQGRVLTEAGEGQDRGTHTHALSGRCPEVRGQGSIDGRKGSLIDGIKVV